MSKGITPRQLQALQIRLQQIGLGERAERLEWLSARLQRNITSTGELSYGEARWLLARLNETGTPHREHSSREEARALVGKIYACSFRIGFLNKDYTGNHTPEDVEMNKAKINLWVRHYSGIGKDISRMNLDELKKVNRIMQKIARKEEGK